MARHGANLVMSGARTLGTARAMRVGAVIAITSSNRSAAKADVGANVEAGRTLIRRQHEAVPSETPDVSMRVDPEPPSDARKISNTKSVLLPEISIAPTSRTVISEPHFPFVESVTGETRNESIASRPRETARAAGKEIHADATPTHRMSGRQEKFSERNAIDDAAVLNAKPEATFRRPPKVDFTSLGAAEQPAREHKPALFAGRPVRIEHVPNLATVEPATRRSLQVNSVFPDSKTQSIPLQRESSRHDKGELMAPSAPVNRAQAVGVPGGFESKNSPPPHTAARPILSPPHADAADLGARSSRAIEPAKPSADSRISIGRLEVQVIQENTVQQSAYAHGHSSFDDAYQLERSYIRNLGRT